MHQEPQATGPDALGEARAATNIFLFAARTLGASVVVFLRRNFGERYLGAPGAAVLIAVPLFITAWPGFDVRPLIWFLGVYFYACVVHRIVIVRRKRRGVVLHSYYGGDSLLRRFFPRMSESTIRRGLEPLVAMIVGLLLMPLNEPLGHYVLLAGCSLFFSESVNDGMQREHVQRMHDAVAEQRYYTERFRQMNGGFA